MIDSRSKILQAASELFLEGGVQALSVRAISRRAGLSTIGIYSHFQGKQGILDTLYIEGFNKVYEAMSVSTEEHASVNDVMLNCERYLSVAKNHEAHYRLIFGDAGQGYEPSSEAREAADRAFGKLVKNTSSFVHANGLTVEPVRASMDIWALLHGYVSISQHGHAQQEWESMALDAVKVHLSALP